MDTPAHQFALMEWLKIAPELSLAREARLVKLLLDSYQSTTSTHPLCTTTLDSAMALLLKDREGRYSRPFFRTFPVKYPDLTNALIAFATTNSTQPNYMARLEMRMSVCTCDRSDLLIKSLHFLEMTFPDDEEIPKSAFASLARNMFKLIVRILEDLDHQNFRRGSSTNKGYEGLATIIGGELSPLFEASTAWFTRTRVGCSAELITRLMNLVPAHVFEDTMVHVFGEQGERGWLRMVISHICDTLTGFIRYNYNFLHYGPLHTEDVFALVYAAQDLTELSLETLTKIWRPDAEFIFVSICNLIQHTENAPASSIPTMRSILPNLSVVALKVLSVLDPRTRNRLQASTYRQEHAALLRYQEIESQPRSYEAMFLHIKACRELSGKRCFNANCKTEGTNFQQCSSCKIATYCCTSCQQEAWSKGSAPHKRLCKSWKLLSDAWPTKSGTLSGVPGIMDWCESGGQVDDTEIEAKLKLRVESQDASFDARRLREIDELSWDFRNAMISEPSGA